MDESFHSLLMLMPEPTPTDAGDLLRFIASWIRETCPRACLHAKLLIPPSNLSHELETQGVLATPVDGEFGVLVLGPSELGALTPNQLNGFHRRGRIFLIGSAHELVTSLLRLRALGWEPKKLVYDECGSTVLMASKGKPGGLEVVRR